MVVTTYTNFSIIKLIKHLNNKNSKSAVSTEWTTLIPFINIILKHKVSIISFETY